MADCSFDNLAMIRMASEQVRKQLFQNAFSRVAMALSLKAAGRKNQACTKQLELESKGGRTSLMVGAVQMSSSEAQLLQASAAVEQ